MSTNVKDRTAEQQEIFMKAWADSYADVSKMWEDSYVNLQKPWMETTGDLIEKAVELSSDATSEQYQEFYGEWQKSYQRNFGKVYPIPSPEADRETLEKLKDSAKDSIQLYKSWIAALEENTTKTEAVLAGEADAAAYKECYDQWAKSYEKIFDELLATSSVEATREIMEKYTGIPDAFLGSFVQIAKLWRNTYSKLYEPLTDAASGLSAKAMEIAKGGARPDAYKDFYAEWVRTYEETYGKHLKSAQTSTELFDNFRQGTDVYLNMYKSWITALEQMADKSSQLASESGDPQVAHELYTLWMQMYEKAFDGFFDGLPFDGPAKQMMEPVKTMVDIYTDTLGSMSKMWSRSAKASGKI